MKNSSRLTIALAGCVVLISAHSLTAQDWSQWRGPNRDGKVTGFTPPQQWPQALTQKWKTPVGSGDATPALVGDKLFIFTRLGGDEVIACLKASDGTQIWQKKYAAQAVTGAAARHPGPRSSPTVADGKVVTLGVGGVLSCFDAADGKELWRKDEFPRVVPQFFVAMSPIVIDGVCIAHVGGKDNGAVIAYNLGDGAEKWRWAGDGPAYSSPVILTAGGTKQVLVQTEKNLVSFSVADGKLLWKISTPTQGRVYNSATPIVDGETVYYTGQGKGTRAVKISKAGDAFEVKELWSNPEFGTGYNTPVLEKGLLFGLSEKGNLFCLKAGDGQTAWSDTAKLGNFGSIVSAGSVLFAMPANSELIGYKPDASKFDELARYKLSESQTYATPVISGNRFFIKDADNVTLWVLE